MPAVSTMTNSSPSWMKVESMASRVVPATLDTMERSSPMMAFVRELLPTFGRPDDGDVNAVVFFVDGFRDLFEACVDSVQKIAGVGAVGG